MVFFREFQKAFLANDRKAVASLISYPILTTLHGRKVYIKTQARLLAHYAAIFDAGVRCEVQKATEKEVWGNDQGFTIGNGAIWFEGMIPAHDKTDVNAPDFWTKFPFKVKTVNNASPVPCKPG